jgi:hypothetical protein
VTSPQAAVLIAGALFLIAAMYVWMIRSNRRHHQQIERRRHEWNTGVPEDELRRLLESDLAESVKADHEETLR